MQSGNLHGNSMALWSTPVISQKYNRGGQFIEVKKKEKAIHEIAAFNGGSGQKK